MFVRASNEKTQAILQNKRINSIFRSIVCQCFKAQSFWKKKKLGERTSLQLLKFTAHLFKKHIDLHGKICADEIIDFIESKFLEEENVLRHLVLAR